MNETERRHMPKRDKAGPFLLMALLASAFLPSVFISFDLSRLRDALSACASAAEGQRPAPLSLFLSVRADGALHADRPATPPDCETCAAYLVSVEAGTGFAFAPVPAHALRASVPRAPERPFLWPLGTMPSPRAPPSGRDSPAGWAIPNDGDFSFPFELTDPQLNDRFTS